MIDNLIQIVVSATGIIMSIGHFPQAYRLYRTHNTEALSLGSYVIFAFGTLIMTLYGIYRQDLVIILSFGVGVLGSWAVFVQLLFYRHWKARSSIG